MPRIRIVPAMFALVLTFAVLFGGFQAYQRYELTQPLQQQLSRISAVQSATVNMGGSSPTVEVRLGLVPDLQKAYARIASDVFAALGSPVNIILLDHPSVQLTNSYETTFQPILSQGIAQGDYVNMFAEFAKAASSLEITGRITMNEKDIFVQLRKGSAYLYEVVPYTNVSAGGSGQ